MYSIIKDLIKTKNKSDSDINLSAEDDFSITVSNAIEETKYCFSCPIYKESNRQIIDLKFLRKDNIYQFSGVNYDVKFNSYQIEFSGRKSFIVLFKETNNFSLQELKGRACLLSQNLIIYPTFNGIVVDASLVNKANEFEIDFLEPVGDVVLQEDFFCAIENGKPTMTLNCFYGLNFNNEKKPVQMIMKQISKTKFKFILSINNTDIEKQMRVIFEINGYVPKLFLDTIVSKKFPDTNFAYKSLAFINKDNEDNEQLIYTKIDCEKFFETIQNNLIDVKFYIPFFNEREGPISVFSSSEEWCSLGTTWNNKKDFYGEAIKSKKILDYHCLDIKKIFIDDVCNLKRRFLNLIIKGGVESNGFNILSTADNCFKPLILEVSYFKNN